MSDENNVIATIKLSKKIQNNQGEMVGEIIIKEPTTADYVRLGDMWSMSMDNGKQSFKMDNAVGMKYLSACTGIQPVLLEAMSIGNTRAALQAIGAFLGDQQEDDQAG